MERLVRSAAGIAAAAMLLAACSSGNEETYAHESLPHPTAAEQLPGGTGGAISDAPAGSTAVTTGPTSAEPSGPLTVPQPVSRVSPSDAAFAQQVAGSNAAEIELARLAYVRTQSPEVRAFARQMLIDHREMAINLDNFALERGYLVAWRIEPDKLATMERLSTLDSASFDRAYMEEMVADHEAAVAMLETHAASGREMAGLATESLPTIRRHLEMARELHARL